MAAHPFLQDSLGEEAANGNIGMIAVVAGTNWYFGFRKAAKESPHSEKLGLGITKPPKSF
jgi:hypothetical protein